MSELSEKETIEYLEKMEKEYKQFGDLQNPDYEDEDKIHKAIQGILDLYKQEKEKNKELKKQLNDKKDLNSLVNVLRVQGMPKDQLAVLMENNLWKKIYWKKPLMY